MCALLPRSHGTPSKYKEQTSQDTDKTQTLIKKRKGTEADEKANWLKNRMKFQNLP